METEVYAKWRELSSQPLVLHVNTNVERYWIITNLNASLNANRDWDSEETSGTRVKYFHPNTYLKPSWNESSQILSTITKITSSENSTERFKGRVNAKVTVRDAVPLMEEQATMTEPFRSTTGYFPPILPDRAPGQVEIDIFNKPPKILSNTSFAGHGNYVGIEKPADMVFSRKNRAVGPGHSIFAKQFSIKVDPYKGHNNPSPGPLFAEPPAEIQKFSLEGSGPASAEVPGPGPTHFVPSPGAPMVGASPNPPGPPEPEISGEYKDAEASNYASRETLPTSGYAAPTPTPYYSKGTIPGTPGLDNYYHKPTISSISGGQNPDYFDGPRSHDSKDYKPSYYGNESKKGGYNVPAPSPDYYDREPQVPQDVAGSAEPPVTETWEPAPVTHGHPPPYNDDRYLYNKDKSYKSEEAGPDKVPQSSRGEEDEPDAPKTWDLTGRSNNGAPKQSRGHDDYLPAPTGKGAPTYQGAESYSTKYNDRYGPVPAEYGRGEIPLPTEPYANLSPYGSAPTPTDPYPYQAPYNPSPTQPYAPYDPYAPPVTGRGDDRYPVPDIEPYSKESYGNRRGSGSTGRTHGRNNANPKVAKPYVPTQNGQPGFYARYGSYGGTAPSYYDQQQQPYAPSPEFYGGGDDRGGVAPGPNPYSMNPGYAAAPYGTYNSGPPADFQPSNAPYDQEYQPNRIHPSNAPWESDNRVMGSRHGKIRGEKSRSKPEPSSAPYKSGEGSYTSKEATSKEDYNDRYPKNDGRERDYDDRYPKPKPVKDDYDERMPGPKPGKEDYDDRYPQPKRNKEDYDDRFPPPKPEKEDYDDRYPQPKPGKEDYDDRYPQPKSSKEDYDDRYPKAKSGKGSKATYTAKEPQDYGKIDDKYYENLKLNMRDYEKKYEKVKEPEGKGEDGDTRDSTVDHIDHWDDRSPGVVRDGGMGGSSYIDEFMSHDQFLPPSPQPSPGGDGPEPAEPGSDSSRYGPYPTPQEPYYPPQGPTSAYPGRSEYGAYAEPEPKTAPYDDRGPLYGPAPSDPSPYAPPPGPYYPPAPYPESSVASPADDLSEDPYSYPNETLDTYPQKPKVVKPIRQGTHLNKSGPEHGNHGYVYSGRSKYNRNSREKRDEPETKTNT